jgi:lipopolysaccharide assembly outer membrane protein LptD (OstA)
LSRPGILFLLHIMFLIVVSVDLHAQNKVPSNVEDSLARADTLMPIKDTLAQNKDSIVIDSIVLAKKAKKPILESEVKYASGDSLSFLIGQQKVYLFDKATVNYQDINLKADYIEFDYGSKTVMATGAIDSSGSIAGKPVFKQGDDESIDSDTMRYNFDTHKGIIKYIVTKQGEGYLHSTRTKRFANGEIDISKGKYTTCDAPHPHFYIALSKAIAIPNKRIVSGPLYLVFEDIPLPLALPFGFFPNTNKRASGLIIPDFRDEQRRGFGLENGGWYFALNDYVDFTVLGSIYSRGTWGLNTTATYLVKYKYSGQFRALYFINRINDDPTSTHSKDFKITWTHSQDPKANPTRTFRANVDFSTSSYERNQSNNYNNLLQNQKNSSIAFTKNWPGRPFNLSANLNGSQSSNTHIVNMTLPTMTFNMNSIYPFRGKKNDGHFNWFENIQVSYNSKLENRISRPDSLLFNRNTIKNMKNGFSHSIPVSLANIKLLKFINITPSVNYNGVLYTKYIVKKAPSDTSIFRNVFETDTIHKVTYAHAFTASLGISASPKLYGMFVSTRPNSYIAAIRHVLTPSVSFNFTPDMSGLMPNYYRKVAYPSSITRKMQESQTYSVYEQEIYGTPSVNGRSGSVSMGLNNNLEMKVRSKSDTTGEGKKVSILDNLNFNTRYNPFANSYKWSPVSMSGSTRLFNKNLNIQFRSTFDPYALDSTGKNRIDKYLIRETGKLFRITNASVDLNFSLQSPAGNKKKGTTGSNGEQPTMNEPDAAMDIFNESSGSLENDYVDYDIPWRINVNYSWSYSKATNVTVIRHTIGINGDISLTPKWKIGMNTNYDFVSRRFTTTNISIHRDLHCWEMQFGIVPFGFRKSYSFTINAKSSILRDLKWDKRKSWYDNF